MQRTPGRSIYSWMFRPWLGLSIAVVLVWMAMALIGWASMLDNDFPTPLPNYLDWLRFLYPEMPWMIPSYAFLYGVTCLPFVWICRYHWGDRPDWDWRERAVLRSLFWPINLIVLLITEVIRPFGFWLAELVSLLWFILSETIVRVMNGPLSRMSRFLSWVAALPDRIVFRLTLRKIQEDEFGELWTAQRPHDPVAYVELRVKDSTGSYSFRVPPDVRTAKEAVAWSYPGVSIRDLSTAVRY